MRNLDIVQLIQREIKAALKLVPWLVVSFLLIALLWRSDLAVFAGLYQSPAGLFQSPATETPEPPPSPTFTPTEARTVEPEAPRITATPTATEPLPEPTETPIEVTETPTPTVPATATPTATPTMSPTPAPTVVSATATPTASPTAEGSDRYSEGNSNLKFEWGMLFDSVALGMTYLWLCCGVFVLLGIPIAFIILWVASKRYGQPEVAEQGGPEPQEQSEE